eukprot:7187999-Prymnesium_polylepis.1
MSSGESSVLAIDRACHRVPATLLLKSPSLGLIRTAHCDLRSNYPLCEANYDDETAGRRSIEAASHTFVNELVKTSRPKSRPILAPKVET